MSYEELNLESARGLGTLEVIALSVEPIFGCESTLIRFIGVREKE